MKILLDTVALYRAATAPDTLPSAAVAAIMNEANELHVSLISAWELTIKSQLGKLELPCPVDQFFTDTALDLRAQILGLELAYLAKLANLKLHHTDPFDRLIIAQAIVGDCVVITSDRSFAAYGVNVIW
jgi:PIN domain nuclease of toxin-antitoxin system